VLTSKPVTAPATVNESVDQAATAQKRGKAIDEDRIQNTEFVTHESGDRPVDRSTVRSRRAIR